MVDVCAIKCKCADSSTFAYSESPNPPALPKMIEVLEWSFDGRGSYRARPPKRSERIVFEWGQRPGYLGTDDGHSDSDESEPTDCLRPFSHS
jgi:hypothetical protein